MRHSLEDSDSSNPKPNIRFKRKELNNIYSGFINEDVRISTQQLLNKEIPDAIGNSEYVDYNFDSIKSKFDYSLSGVVATKVLESTIIDYTDDDPYPLIDYQLNHWLFYASSGVYTAPVIIKEPRTGVDINLTPFDAFIYWFYIFSKSIGVNYNNKSIFANNSIPDFLATRVIKPNRVNINQVRQVSFIEDISIDLINYILDTQLPVISLLSVNAFNLRTLQILKNSNEQQNLLSLQEHKDRRAMLETVVNSLYYDVRIDTNNVLSQQGTVSRTFPEWLNEKNIVDYDYSRDECITIYSQLFTSATGGNLYSTKLMTELQKSLIKLMKQLSSYSVQYITEINSTSIRKLNWSTIRLGDIRSIETKLQQVELCELLPEIIEVQENNLTKIESQLTSVKTITGSIQSNRKDIEIKVKPYLSPETGALHAYQIRFGTITINPCLWNDPAFVGGIKILDSYQEFYNLAPEDKKTIKDVYFTVFEQDINAGKVNINNVVIRDIIPDFNYTRLKTQILKAFKPVFIPQKSKSTIKNLLNISLSIFKSNIGSITLPAYSLFNATNVLELFKYFANSTVINSFNYNGGELYIDPLNFHQILEMGNSLEIFKGVFTPTSIQGFNYSNDIRNINVNYGGGSSSINFVRPFFTTSVALHPTAPGQILESFRLLNSSVILGGFEYAGYSFGGFSINGSQVNFDA